MNTGKLLRTAICAASAVVAVLALWALAAVVASVEVGR